MVRVRKPQYAGETQLDSFSKLFDIYNLSPAHNYQLLSGHWGQFTISNQEHFLSTLLGRQGKRSIGVILKEQDRVGSRPEYTRLAESSSAIEAVRRGKCVWCIIWCIEIHKLTSHGHQHLPRNNGLFFSFFYYYFLPKSSPHDTGQPQLNTSCDSTPVV